MRRVLVLHPGAMGAAVAEQVRRAGAEVWWVRDGRGPATGDRAAAAGLLTAESLADGLARTEVVLSICPPEFAVAVARDVAAHDWSGTYVDANAISPQRMAMVVKSLSDAAVVDGSLIGGPPSQIGGPRLYLSGDAAPVATIAELFSDTTVEACDLGKPIGAASALKMAFGGYQKTSRALAAVCQTLAAEHGVDAELTAEGRRLAARPLGDIDYLPSLAARAWRWGPEMREVADSLAAAGIPDALLGASATTMAAWTNDKDAEVTIAEVLDRLRQGRR